VDMVDDLCDRGRLSAAMTAIERFAVEEANDGPSERPTRHQQTVILDELHPYATMADSLPSARVGPVLMTPDLKDFEYVVRQLRTSASPGATGWTNALIRRVALHDGHSEALLLQMHKFVVRSMKGEVGVYAADLLSTSRSVLIPKPDGGMRPLGVGEAWYRLIARCVCREVVRPASAALAPLQLGSGYSGGVEICARLPLLALAGDDGGDVDVCVFTLDIKNAFNSMRRSLILKGIREYCPEIEPWFRRFYGGPADLRFSSGHKAGESQSGVRQGDPMSMLLFALGFHACLLLIKGKLNDALATHGFEAIHGYMQAFADDISGACPAVCIPDFSEGVQEILAANDLLLVPSKCAIHGRLAHTIMNPFLPVRSEGITKVVGCPVGPPAFRRAAVTGLLDKMTDSLPLLQDYSPQASFLLITKCINARANFLCRVTELPDAAALFEPFDRRIDTALAALADCPEDHEMRTLRSLPQRLGGLGVYDYSGLQGVKGRNHSRHITYSFAQTHYHSSLFRQTRADTWSDLDLCDDEDTVLNHVLPEAVVSFNKRITATRKLQLEALHTSKIESDPAAAAWLLSSCTPNSGRWLDWRGGGLHRFRMAGDLYVDALSRRLLCPPTQLQKEVAARCCDCSPALSSHPTHLLDCVRNQWCFTRRHTVICQLLASYTRRVCSDSLVYIEHPLQDCTNPMRADLVIVLGTRTYTIDVSITNPSCVSSLALLSASIPDRAASAREDEKRQKYGHLPGMGVGGDKTFTPFVIESTGRLGPSALAFLKILSTPETRTTLSNLLGSISACIAFFNSLLLKCAKRRLGVLERFV
jgi:hypothetical protein